MAVSSQAIRQRAEQLGSVLPPLLVAAERVASTIIQGVHGRRRVGPGEAFWQFRRYQPGDPTSRIDWRQSARGSHVFVRENEWEAAQSVWLWRDASASMSYSSRRDLPEKRERAELLLLATASLLLRGGERFALLGNPSPPASSRASLTRVSLEIMRPEAGESMPPFQPLPRYARVLIIGDLLSPIDEIEAMIGRFAARGVVGHLQQVVDPAEDTLPFKGRVRFEGMENEGSLIVRRTESLRGDYIGRMAEQRRGLANLARTAGWTFGRHSTDQSPQSALLTIYTALSGPGRR